MDLAHLSWLGFLAPVALFYQQTKNVVVRIFRIFWKKRVIPNDVSHEFYRRLYQKSFVFSFDDYTIVRDDEYSLKKNMYIPMFFKMTNMQLFLYRGFIPILVFAAPAYSLNVHYLKFTLNFESFLGEAIKVIQKERELVLKNENRFCIEYRRGQSLKGKSSVSLGNSNSNESITTTAANNAPTVNNYTISINQIFNQKLYHHVIGDYNLDEYRFCRPCSEINKFQLTKAGEKVLHQAKKWLESEKWYNERNIAWRRGFGLYGPPGNGKSTLISEIARQLQIPIFIFDLSSMDNNEFQTFIMQLPNNSAIILFEDIDSVFEGRTNLQKTENYGGLSFDCLLNALSGVNSIRNKLIFITTNHIEKLDKALLREGRIDELIEIPPLTIPEKRAMAKIILDRWPEEIEKMLVYGAEDSTATFENRCVRVALEHFWNDK